MMRNGFTKKNIGTLTLGEKLKKLREDKRLSLNEISKATKIQVKHLDYLEKGFYEKLPADVYVKGFLRSYADFFGLDKQIFLRLYNKEKGIEYNLKKKNNTDFKKIKPINISAFIFTPKKILILVISIFILVGLFLLYREIGSFASTPRLVVLSPLNNSEITSNSIYVEGIVDKDASLFINNQPILVNDEGKFRENVALQTGVNVINIKAVNKFKKIANKVIIVRSDYQVAKKNNNSQKEASQKKAIIKNKEITIELSVNPGPVWLNVKADGELVFNGTMLSGAIQMFHAKKKIVISSGRGKATFVKFNGNDIGALSPKDGIVKGVTFTHDTKGK